MFLEVFKTVNIYLFNTFFKNIKKICRVYLLKSFVSKNTSNSWKKQKAIPHIYHLKEKQNFVLEIIFVGLESELLLNEERNIVI